MGKNKQMNQKWMDAEPLRGWKDERVTETKSESDKHYYRWIETNRHEMQQIFLQTLCGLLEEKEK